MIPALRSNADAPAPAQPRRAQKAATVACRECGGPHAPARAGGEFCGSACRMAWNNRRAARGAELYDLLMACRYERPRAAALKLWRFVWRLAAQYRAEDFDQRDGRPSWRDPRKVVDERPYLHADVIARPRAGRRRKG